MQPNQPRLVVTINSAGRQAASFIRVASAIGWHVRAQLREKTGIVAEELAGLRNVTVVEGELTDTLIEHLFDGAHSAFVNTTHWGDEYRTGCVLADTAQRAGIKHYVYSSMPDHSAFGRGWQGLPMWTPKFAVEKYVRKLNMPSTFVYTGIYNNNFTSQPYPLFRMELQSDGSFVWEAPFAPDEPQPWLDAEHDVGPALLQIFKQGPPRWAGHRVPLTFEVATPRQACEAFAKALNRRVEYKLGPIRFLVPVPKGYREHLEALQQTLGSKELGFDQAPYFGPTMYFPEEAIELWEGNRGLEEYAHEPFLIEERLNGLTWMDEDDDEMESSTDTIATTPTDETGGNGSKESSVVSERQPMDTETL